MAGSGSGAAASAGGVGAIICCEGRGGCASGGLLGKSCECLPAFVCGRAGGLYQL